MAWGEGHTNNAPAWVDDIEFGRDYGILPHLIEDTVPYHVYEKWRAVRFAQTRRAEVERQKWQRKK